MITNGFDYEDLPPIKYQRTSEKFIISHIGTLGWSRNPSNLWKSLEEISRKNIEFSNKLEIRLIGNVDERIFKEIGKYKLTKYLNYIPYVNHKEAILEQKKANLLLLVINNTPNAKGILTGKFFEYLSSKTPILCIGPKDGDIAKIINETDAGIIKGYHDNITIKDLKNTSSNTTELIKKYSREELTNKLIKVL